MVFSSAIHTSLKLLFGLSLSRRTRALRTAQQRRIRAWRIRSTLSMYVPLVLSVSFAFTETGPAKASRSWYGSTEGHRHVKALKRT